MRNATHEVAQAHRLPQCRRIQEKGVHLEFQVKPELRPRAYIWGKQEIFMLTRAANEKGGETHKVEVTIRPSYVLLFVLNLLCFFEEYWRKSRRTCSIVLDFKSALPLQVVHMLPCLNLAPPPPWFRSCLLGTSQLNLGSSSNCRGS